ncbi:MAG: amidohydrolase [Bacteroidia bacterium]|nr:amidohydrolase [Bacteroidia bacterium]
MKIDMHAHILPPKLPDWKSQFGYGGFVNLEHVAPGKAHMMIDGTFFRAIEENCWNPAKQLEDCDRNGVDVQVVCTVPVMFCYWAKPKDGAAVARFLNDHIATVVSYNPKRFVALGTLPLQDPDLAIAELEYCVKQLGLPGVQIGSHVNDWNLYEPILFPVFEAARDLGACILVHPWDMVGKEKMPKYWLPWLVGMPAETSLAICSLIFGGVLERLPGLRICFAHGGGAFPATIGRIEHGFKVRPDLCAVDNPVNPREYLKRIYFDTIVHDPLMLRYLITLVGAERLMLGSDYPFPLGEHCPGSLIESLDDISQEQKEQMLWKTALEWLNLPLSRFKD